MHASSGWRAGRPTRSTVESFCSLESPGRPDRESALYIQATVDRWHNGQKSDRWPVDRAVDRQANLALTASFSSSINWGIWGLFYIRFLVDFRASFSYSFQRFFSTNLRANIFNQKGSFIKSVLKVIFLSFPPPFQSLFFAHNT